MTEDSGSSATPPSPLDRDAVALVARLHHDLLTGLILATIVKRSEAVAEELVFRLFRRKHLEQFVPGLEKLGLLALPPAVACAQYHYLSNFLGGVRVEYVRESDRKAWIRYPPPRWIWQGVAIAGIPSSVSRAMLRGWHAHNGPSLGVPGLGFVCTKQTVDGQPGLEGYYLEVDGVLEPEERLRFAPGEDAPPIDPSQLPAVPTEDWPEDRLAKAMRNYALDYVRTALVVAFEMLGPADASALVGSTARLIGMHAVVAAEPMEATDESPIVRFSNTLERAMTACGDHVQRVDARGDARVDVQLEQVGWRLMRGEGALHEDLVRSYAELWRGLAMGYDRQLACSLSNLDRDGDDWRLRWRITSEP